ncbi:outer membrane protein [Rhodoplanes sp. Z2-YC6860]|uniref:outer membrane protein n=1 Tax=Rhodoplanes sp. Z2-YC6860 TaxID=674703 RepID=UPI00078E664C|nr:outer membrane beta-barrel protein [Rhodoplanes sp. Z2-YC6860]AMN41372.1 porin [Rhodoplanes sp. Z2-YC6860]
MTCSALDRVLRAAAGITAAFVVMALVGSANAADMPIKAVPMKAPFAPSFSWTGFYAGVHAGWGFNDPAGTSTATGAGITGLTAQHNLDSNGPLFGGHAGYNWQINPRLVIGIEGDITGTGIKTSSAQTPLCSASNPQCAPGQPINGGVMTMSQEVNWLASIRGRLGTTWGPGLIYVTGGAAWANVDSKAATGDAGFNCSSPGGGCSYAATGNATRSGFVVGAGYETALAGNWTVRAEYLYYSFGGETLTAAGTPQTSCGGGLAPPCITTSTFPDLNIHTVRAGLTYKLGQPAGAPFAAFAPRTAAAARSWTGFYAGLDAGWGWGNSTGTSIVSVPGDQNAMIAEHDLGNNGPLFGGHLGYNWQIDPRWVAGIEGDITGTGIKVSSAQTPVCPRDTCGPAPGRPVPGALMSLSQEVNWLASIRGRLGVTFGPGMLYATGGVAWANVDYKSNLGDGAYLCDLPGCGFQSASNTTKTGWVAGGGYETALIGNWTVRAEYLYYSFDGETLTAAATTAAACTGAGYASCTATSTFSDLKIHTARAGVSYRF